MWKKIFKPLPVGEYDLKERMLRSVVQLGGVAALVGTLEMLFLMEESKVMLPLWIIMVLVIGITLAGTFHYRKYEQAAMVLCVIIVVFLFPMLFCVSGGVNSGCTGWLILGLIYMFILFRGRRLVAFILMTIVSYIGVYIVTYYKPELLIPMSSQKAVYIDSIFSIIAVGFIVGIIYQLHLRVFEEEHELNLRQKDELEKSSKSKDIFFANMSHEIRTPINAIMGLNELIMRTTENSQVRAYSQDIQMASNMLLNQVNDILDLSQMEVNKMHPVMVEYETKELIKYLADLIKVQADKKNLELHLDIDKNIPMVMYGDEKRLKQILLNLLDNAVKYTEEGTVTLSASYEKKENGKVLLSFNVSDTGIGIRKENLDGIYDAFNRYDEKRNKRILGTGLGLAITKQLVDMLGGEIKVDSIYRKGTVFAVSITQDIIDERPMGTLKGCVTGEEETEYRALFMAPEARILIVDDSQMNRMVAERLLGETKVKIDTVASGEECLQMTKKKYYDVILLDYLMPEMDGYEVLHELRRQENGLCRDTAVIALTANVLSGARVAYQQMGFDSYVEKPIQGKALETEILRLLPEELVEHCEYPDGMEESGEAIQKISRRKRKKIYITADCTCDIPQELVEKYDIKIMYLYINTPYGRFADTREIDSDSIAQYTSAGSTSAYGDKVSVEEYEEFFAETLTEAEEVIHISLSSKLSKSYEVTVEAAKGFGHVHIIDSGQISCGQALVTLCAAKLAMDGKSVDEIIKEVNEVKNGVHTSFIMPGADIFYQNGRVSKVFAKFCHVFQLHPYAGIKQKHVLFYGLLFGRLEQSWKQAIYCSLLKKRKICKTIIYVTHVGCSVRQLEYIKKEISKRVTFDQIITQKASFTTACSVGMGTIGYAYYTQPKERDLE